LYLTFKSLKFNILSLFTVVLFSVFFNLCEFYFQIYGLAKFEKRFSNTTAYLSAVLIISLLKMSKEN